MSEVELAIAMVMRTTQPRLTPVNSRYFGYYLDRSLAKDTKKKYLYCMNVILCCARIINLYLGFTVGRGTFSLGAHGFLTNVVFCVIGLVQPATGPVFTRPPAPAQSCLPPQAPQASFPLEKAVPRPPSISEQEEREQPSSPRVPG